MKKLATVFLSITLFSSMVLALDNKIVATYIDGIVTEDQVMKKFRSELDRQKESKNKDFFSLDKNLQEILVNGYINSKLLEKEAKRMKIRDSKEFKAKIYGIEMQIAQQEVLEHQINNRITNQMIDNEYRDLVKSLQGQEEVKTSHILVDTEEKAKEIKKKLNKGSNFVDLVKQFSKDEGSKSNSGEIGYVLKGQLVPPYEEKAFLLKKNEISDPVKTQFGWHIIKILDKRAVQIPSRDQADQSIKGKISKDIIENYINELVSKAQIKLEI